MKNSELEELKDNINYINENYINANELISIIEKKKKCDRPWVEICVLNEVLSEIEHLLETNKVSV